VTPPRRSRFTRLLGLVVTAALLPTAAAPAQEGKPVAVEPGELTKRADLIGRLVAVDDRVRLFQFHKGQGWDEFFLKRAPDVTFEIPQRLRPGPGPQPAAVKVRGVLRHDAARWRVEVNAWEALPNDLDRLNRAVALLAKSDVEGRTAWARWGEVRGREFEDEALLTRAREVQGQAIRAAADRPPAGDLAGFWLGLAERARAEKVAEPEPSALAHRGFRAAGAATRTADAWKTLAGRIEAFFPDAPKRPEGAADLARWETPYRDTPADAYRSAPADVRKSLDHLLWSDATQKWLERRASDDPKAQLSLAEEAARLLPDRTEVASRFLEKGAEAAAEDIGALRLSEVETLARLYRETLHQPDRARALLRSWLDDQRDHRLSARDAEGRVALAQQYENYLEDRPAALALLRDAWKLDPESREVADAYRRRGFRKVQGEWAEPARARPGHDTTASTEVESGPKPEDRREPVPRNTPAPPARSNSLRNATPDEVVVELGGKPNRKSRVATQGQVVDQWVYIDPRQTRYVTFVHKPGDNRPRVISYYTLPRTPSDRTPAP